MDSMIFRRNTRKGGRCVRGGERPLNKQIANLKKSISYLSNRIRKPEYRRQIATNSAQIEKQTKELRQLEQQKRISDAEIYAKKAADNAKLASNARAAKENARLAAINAATPTPGLMDTLTSAVGLNPANANKAKLDGLVVEARELAQKLTAAANAINATKNGGKHRNRRTRRK